MTPQALRIRPLEPADEAPLTAVLTPVFRAGDSYTLDPDLPDAAYCAYWTSPGHEVFVAEDAHGALLGTYYMRPNQGGGGAHVCNCGYITAVQARGRGVARAMLAHSLELAPKRGFRAMQYNFVVATNTRAIATWQAAGFREVGRLPGAFKHPQQGYVDALVMMKQFGTEA